MSYVYLAHPIDQAKRDSGHFIMAIKDELQARGLTVFSPSDAWRVNASTDGIQAANLKVLQGADVVLAVVTGDPSIGVPAEMQYAASHDIPVVVWTLERLANGAALGLLATAGIYIDVIDAVGAVYKIISDGFWIDYNSGRTQGLIQREPDVKQFPLPAQAKAGDIGLDLYVSDPITIPPRAYRSIPSRVRVAPPADIWFLIVGRSSSLHRRGLSVIPSVIDSGFRGPLFAMAYNILDTEAVVEPGDRIAQLIPLPMTPFRFTETDVLPDSERGDSGFGSTGA